jgi:L-seryl-tRNA(Ser) seleniumtransferase
MAALQAWQIRDANAIRAREAAALALWQTALQHREGIACACIDDPTGNPLQRLWVSPLPASGWTARTLADALAKADPAVMVRDYQTDLGYFDLDPCNLHDGDEQVVAQQLRTLLDLRR